MSREDLQASSSPEAKDISASSRYTRTFFGSCVWHFVAYSLAPLASPKAFFKCAYAQRICALQGRS